jgi:Dienelactone hydrolase family
VHEYIRDSTRRFAKEGYYAIAPKLFQREGGVAHLPNLQDILKIVLSQPRPPERGLGDLSGPLLAEPLNQRPRPRHALGGHHQLLGERNPERARGVDAKLGGHAALVGAGIE